MTVTAPVATVLTDRTPGSTSSLVVTPAVVAHRGASGHRPEHTLAAYRAAIRMGVDDIELDLVSTRDHVLVARHDLELSATTDVADRAEFAARRTTRVVDGVGITGWFVQDFTVAELKRLTARERWPGVRPDSAAYDGTEGIATLTEILAMVGAESSRRGRAVGVMCELKHAEHHDRAGLPLDDPLLADLARHELDGPFARVTIMAFEPTILRRLATRVRHPILQLVAADLTARPADLAASADPRVYADLISPDGLDWVDEYADGLGVHADLVLPRDDAGAVATASTLVRDAHSRWLTVHVWTARAENRFLPANHRCGEEPNTHGDIAGFARRLLAAGVDGIITDHPDRVVGLVEPASAPLLAAR